MNGSTPLFDPTAHATLTAACRDAAKQVAPWSTQEGLLVINEDRMLIASQLDDKYNPNGDGQHPVFTRESWRQAVSESVTIIGYWDWVEYQIESTLSFLPVLAAAAVNANSNGA